MAAKERKRRKEEVNHRGHREHRGEGNHKRHKNHKKNIFAPFVVFVVPSFLASVDALGQVEAIEVHHLDPRVHEVAHELLLPIVASVDFGDGSELGV